MRKAFKHAPLYTIIFVELFVPCGHFLLPFTVTMTYDNDPSKQWYPHGRRHEDGNGICGSILPHLPRLGALSLRVALGGTLVLYILNQQHMLPRQLSGIVSKALFWPSLPITACKRIGKWVTKIDDTIVMGGAPFGLLGYPERLHEDYKIKGVINLCEEYRGPVRRWRKLGAEELYLPTTDHFEPSREDLLSALSFIKRHQSMGNRVYVHCRAGHGRSGAVVFAWLMMQDPDADPEQLNAELCKVRNVRKSLWKQPNIQALHHRFKNTGGALVNAKDAFFGQGHEEKEAVEDELKKDL
jgi:atypical dual specificity phosphatase